MNPRFQTGPSAGNSFDPKEGRFSNNYGADQQRWQISEFHFDKFRTPTTFACWKIRFKTEVCTCSQFHTEAMLWIKEVEMVDSVDDLKSSFSVRGIRKPNFEVLDARIASALNRIMHNSHFKRRISLEEPSARNSVDPSEGRFSKDFRADQQRLQISDLHFDKFPTPATFACWKIRFKTEVCTCSQFPTEAIQWIKEVELVDSVDDLRSSSFFRGISMPNFELLDARIASALNKIIHNSHLWLLGAENSCRRLRSRRRSSWCRMAFPGWGNAHQEQVA